MENGKDGGTGLQIRPKAGAADHPTQKTVRTLPGPSWLPFTTIANDNDFTALGLGWRTRSSLASSANASHPTSGEFAFPSSQPICTRLHPSALT